MVLYPAFPFPSLVVTWRGRCSGESPHPQPRCTQTIMMLLLMCRQEAGFPPSVQDLVNGVVKDSISSTTDLAKLHADLRAQGERIDCLESTKQRYERMILRLLTQAGPSVSMEGPQTQEPSLPVVAAAQTLYAAINPQSTATSVTVSADSPSQLPLLAAPHAPQPLLLMQSHPPAQSAIEQAPQIVRPQARVGGPLPPIIDPARTALPRAGGETSRPSPGAASPQASALPLHTGPSEIYQQGFRPLSSQRNLARQLPSAPAPETAGVEGLSPWNPMGNPTGNPPFLMGSPPQRGFSGGTGAFQAASAWQPGRTAPPHLPLPPDQPPSHLPGLSLPQGLTEAALQIFSAHAQYQQPMYSQNTLQQIFSHINSAALNQGAVMRSLGEGGTGGALPAQAAAQAQALATALMQQPPSAAPGIQALMEALAVGGSQASLHNPLQQVLHPLPPPSPVP